MRAVGGSYVRLGLIELVFLTRNIQNVFCFYLIYAKLFFLFLIDLYSSDFIRDQCHSAKPKGTCVQKEQVCSKQRLVGGLLEFYVFATSMVISGPVLTGDSVHSWRFYSADPLGTQAAVRYSTRLVCCCFTSQHNLRSYHDGYRFVAVRTHGDFIQIPHWDTRLPPP